VIIRRESLIELAANWEVDTLFFIDRFGNRSECCTFRQTSLARQIVARIGSAYEFFITKRKEGRRMLQQRATIAFVVTLALLQNLPAAEDSRSAKERLTPDGFAKLHALVRPHDDEWRHLRVHWLTDVVAARKKAAVEDKPIVICYTGGAGYNEPLGTC
jgi:hypothetical protein